LDEKYLDVYQESIKNEKLRFPLVAITNNKILIFSTLLVMDEIFRMFVEGIIMDEKNWILSKRPAINEVFVDFSPKTYSG